MFEKLEQQVHEFYSNKYLRNRYPSLSYVSTKHGFINGDSPDIAAVALGYKPAALWHEDWSDVNSHYITKCAYRGKELFHLGGHYSNYFNKSEANSIVVCDRADFSKFELIFNQVGKCREWGELLGYPKHLVNLFAEFVECDSGRNLPDWDTYNAKAEEMALRLCLDMD